MDTRNVPQGRAGARVVWLCHTATIAKLSLDLHVLKKTVFSQVGPVSALSDIF